MRIHSLVQIKIQSNYIQHQPFLPDILASLILLVEDTFDVIEVLKTESPLVL